MNNSDDFIKENFYSPNWRQIPDHPNRFLIIWISGSGKTNSLFNLINQEPDIDKIYLYNKDPYKPKCQLLISKIKSTGLKDFIDAKSFIEYLSDMDKIYKSNAEYKRNKNKKH